MATEPPHSEAENVAIVHFVPLRDNTKFHYPDDNEDHFIVDEFCAGLLLQVEVTDVIKGHLTREGSPATLLLITNRFLGFTSQRRFREVELIINFHDAKKSSFYDPEVVKVWPDGEYTYRESPVEVEDTKGASGNVGGGYAGVSVNISANWERKTSSTQIGRARMTGARWRGASSRIRNGVRLFIQENANQKDGIISEVHTSVLLRQRNPDRELSAELEIIADGGQRFKAEWKYRGLRGERSIKSPAFSPRTTARSANINAGFLQDEDLGRLSGVPAQKKIENA